MKYDHTQRAPIWLILVGIAIIELVLALSFRPTPARLLLLGMAGLLFLLASAFAHLRVREEQDTLRIAFGPLELASRRIAYEDIVSFRRGRSTLIDGWGIHWIPGRGWTWNIWGRDCVEIETPRGTLRLGTNDAGGLERHLTRRTAG